ncbi:hypothetical protein LEP1GSC172_1791 [Leptospira noguchii]|uniref:Uncharacterized protein n=1 Tax=Leptospira noguchii TaxID=28182 RepID=M6V9Q0_9LEPT|nr:hypothetical protein LEP1GSC172_1791 [Leptospira noguchii]
MNLKIKSVENTTTFLKKVSFALIFFGERKIRRGFSIKK